MEKKYCHFPCPPVIFLEEESFIFKSVLERRLYLLLALVFHLMCLCFVIPFDVLLLATVGRSASLQTAHHPHSFSPPLTVLSNYFQMPKHLQHYWQTFSREASISSIFPILGLLSLNHYRAFPDPGVSSQLFKFVQRALISFFQHLSFFVSLYKFIGNL